MAPVTSGSGSGSGSGEAVVSRFGDSDPTDTALSPWLWVPICTMMVLCVCFISFRRAHSLELWDRFTQSYHLHSPFGKRTSAIRLAGSANRRPRPASSRARSNESSEGSDDDDEASDDDPTDDLDDGDELPSSAPPPRLSAPQRALHGVHSILDTLGWTSSSHSPSSSSSNGGFSRKSPGIATAFWGLRRQDRRGGIRLPSDNDSPSSPERTLSSSSTPRRKPPLSLRTPSEPLAHVPVPPGRGVPASPRASASPTLFDLGEEDEEMDAVELPAEFVLPKGQEHPLEWGGEGKAGGVPRGMQRLA